MSLRLAAAVAGRVLAPRAGRQGMSGAVAAMGLSLVPLLLIQVVSNGMIEGITRRLIEAGTYHLQVALPATIPADGLEALLGRIRQVPEVRLAFAETQGLGLVYTPRARLGLQVRAVPAGLYGDDAGLRETLRMTAGGFDLDERRVVLGRTVAEELGVGVGDDIRILTARQIRGRFVPRITRFTVSGLFASGYQELDKGWAYIGPADGAQIVPRDAGRLVIGVKVRDLSRLEQAARSVEGAVAASGTPGFVASWYELEENQYRSFQTTRALLVFIMALIVVVAAVNVSAAVAAIVLEKRPEIAILKSLGAPPRTLEAAFVAAGFVAGTLGAAVGVPLGLLVSVNVNTVVRLLEGLVNTILAAASAIGGLFGVARPFSPLLLLNPAFYLDSIPVRISLPETAASAALAIVVSTLAAWLPARRAAAIKPLDVLRRG
jgi:lipoprotein-releasing system permease protein